MVTIHEVYLQGFQEGWDFPWKSGIVLVLAARRRGREKIKEKKEGR
jgi:hypothetical protein